jgi:hypothetical protein
VNNRRKYVLFLVLILSGGLLLWWFWPPAQPPTQTAKPPAVAKPPLAVIGPGRQVLAPTMKPVAASSTAQTPLNPGVPPDLNDTISQAIDLLRSQDIPGLMQKVLEPNVQDEWRQEMLHNGAIQDTNPMTAEVRLREMLTPDQLRQIMLQQGIPVNEKLIATYTHYTQPDKMRARFLAELQSIQNQPPEIGLDGVHALYHLNIDGDGTSALFFEKINGQWYLQY